MISMKKRAFVNEKECVACGSCIKACPCKAIYVNNGVYAKIIEEKCVGCGKCANECPADVISIIELEVNK